MLVATVVMAIATCAAVVVTLMSIKVARAARDQAVRSADAAEASADAARRSAEASEQAATLERERRHDELRPQLVATRVGEESLGCDLVRLDNAGPLSYTLDRCVLLDAESGAADGIGAPGDSAWGGYVVPDPAALELGGRTELSIHRRSKDDGGEVRVRVECQHDDERWSVVVAVDLPHPPRVMVF